MARAVCRVATLKAGIELVSNVCRNLEVTGLSGWPLQSPLPALRLQLSQARGKATLGRSQQRQ